MGDPVRIFYSFSHRDEADLDTLKAHLAEVRRQGLIEDWYDRRIAPGEDWSSAIADALDGADLVLLLVTKDFLASEYCNGIELRRALELVQAGTARIIPVYVRPAYWKGAPFARFQGVPKDARPVNEAKDPDAAWVEVVEGIVRAARELRGEAEPRRGLPRPSPGLRRPVLGLPWILGGTAALLLAAALAAWWPGECQGPAVTAHLAQGHASMGTGRYAEALDAYVAALALAADCGKAAYGRDKAQVLADIGPGFDVEAAHLRLRTLEQAHPNDPHIHLMVGRLAANGRDWEAARARLRRALDLDPKLPEAWFALGVLAHQEGRLAEALGHYGKAVALAPRHRQYLTNLAGLRLDLGDYRAALAGYEGVLADARQLLLARLDAGNAARLGGDLDKAAWHHERLLLDLGRPGVLEQGDNAAQWAFEAGERELTLDGPEGKRAYARLSVSLTRFLRGDRQGAEQLAGEAAGSPERERARALIEFDLGRLGRARPDWAGPIADYRRLIDRPAP